MVEGMKAMLVYLYEAIASRRSTFVALFVILVLLSMLVIGYAQQR